MRRVLSLYETTIGKKWVMATTGILLVGFVIAHMLGNLKVYTDLAGPSHDGHYALDQYGHWLRTFGEPALPRMGLLWIARLVLLGAVALHIHAAVTLTRLSRAARDTGYRKFQPEASNYASRTMRIGGVLLVGFIVYHILHFTTGHAHTGPFEHGAVHANLVNAFSLWWVAALYVLAMVFLGLHLYHGVWSLTQTLGWDNPRFEPWRRRIALGIALLVALGNISIPVAVLTGIVQLP